MPKYRLPDEPRPGALQRIVVSPTWPLFASMLGGPWIGWPWFVLNAHAVGSPTRWRQTLLAAGGLIVTFGLLVAIGVAHLQGILPDGIPLRLGILLLFAWKITVAYVLASMQWRSVELFEYYRGIVRNGMLVVVAIAILGDKPLASLPDLLRMVLE